MTNKHTGPLSGLRVIELADERGRWCGRLLAELGADVIKIEQPDGSPERDTAPFYHDKPHRERSLSFWHYNAGKRGITLNLETTSGTELFRKLVSTADVLLETNPPGYLPSLKLGPDELRGANTKLIYCSLTPFGQDGPWHGYKTTDLLHMAGGGQMASSGYDEDELPDAPPIAPGGGNAWHIGSHYALLAISTALFYRDVTDEGQYLDISIHEACALTTEMAVPIYFATNRSVRRQTGRHAAYSMPRPATQFRCKDGTYINAMFNQRLSPQQLRSIAEWLDEYNAADDLLEEHYAEQQVINEQQNHISEVLRNFFPKITSEEAYRGAQQRGLAWGAVRTIDDILADPHWDDRGYWVEVDHPELTESFRYPGAWAIYSESPLAISRRAPLVGEHNAEIYGELGLGAGDLGALQQNGVI